jgi:GAF domain-containing protein
MMPTVIFQASALLVRHGFDTDSVVRALEYIGVGLEVDRVYLFEDVMVDGARYTSQRYEWSSLRADPQIDNPALQEIPYSAIAPDWPEIFDAGGMVKGLVCELPSPTREFLEAQSIRSILVCPILIDGACWGFLGLDDCHSDRLWPDVEVRALQRFAHGLRGALNSQRSAEALMAAAQILQGLTDEGR